MVIKNKFGFSVVEILITVFIFLILIGAIVLVFIVGRSSWQVGGTRIGLQNELRRGMNWMAEELRAGGLSTITGVPADGSWYNTIAFRKAKDVAGGYIIVWDDEATQYLRGGLNGEQLLRQVGSEQEVLANNISSFQVRRQPQSKSIVEIALGAQKRTARGNLLDATLNFQIKLRN